MELIRQTIDPKRFPWLATGAAPAAEKLQVAKVASAVVATCQRVQTKRRGDEQAELERAIVRLIVHWNLRACQRRTVQLHAEDLRKASDYMVGATLGNDNGYCIIGLYDRRRLGLECKSSNSEINGYPDFRVGSVASFARPATLLKRVIDTSLYDLKSHLWRFTYAASFIDKALCAIMTYL